MSKLRVFIGKTELSLILAIIFIFGGFFTFTKIVRSSPDQYTGVLTESDFARDSDLSAFPEGNIVATFLESPTATDEENDTGTIGLDVIPYKYTDSIEQTFCWDDDNESAEHSMTLLNSDGGEVFTIDAKGDCVTRTIGEGDYEMHIRHDGKSNKRIAIFIVPEANQSLLTTASDEALQNVTSVLNSDKCIGCDLSNVNLNNTDLSGVDLSNAILDNAILVDADLSGANLSGASFKNADMSRANLKGANLSGADLTNAILINADLTEADLTNANLEKADIEGTNFSNALMTGTLLIRSDKQHTGSNQIESGLGVTRDLVVELCTGGTLPPGDGTKDLRISQPCNVGNGTDKIYQYKNVNIVNNGILTFMDEGEGSDIHFWAKSILVESGGSLIAGTDTDADAFGAKGGTLTIHLYGSDTDKTGIVCRSNQPTTGIPCGINPAVWNSNGTERVDLPNLPGKDYFYQYRFPDQVPDETGFFGRKVLAVSYNGTLKLFGKKGATYRDNVENWDSGVSWVRLKDDKDADKTHINLDREVDWEPGDRLVVTTTDYLPGHSEEVQIIEKVLPRRIKTSKNGSNKETSRKFLITVIDPITNMPPDGCTTPPLNKDKCGLKYNHNGDLYPDTGDFKDKKLDRLNLDVQIKDGGDENGEAKAETRAAVALLTRSIRIVSAGDEIPAESKLTCKYDCFPPINVDAQGIPTATQYYYGGHTMVRQGVSQVMIQGVEFYQLGQGGRKGRYPVHFHLARKTPPDVYAKDNSVNDSMTRWYTIHGTQGVTLARNVGYKSIGHGYYLEDGSETDNELYSNIGVFARAAIDNIQNPRKVPGILAWIGDSTPPPPLPGVPYRSDWQQPTVFWIMNGWNDFEYNMAAGANACGACYWWLPGAVSGPSQGMDWEGYASLQSGTKEMNEDGSYYMINLQRAGLSPLKTFKGNYCTSAMNAFNTTKDTSVCNGISVNGTPSEIIKPIIEGNMSPKPKLAPPLPAIQLNREIFYPKTSGSHRPTICNGPDCSNLPQKTSACDFANIDSCLVTVIDRFTSAFNWAETNFSAIWLRPQWYLVINSVISDVQNAGLTFVTGGDYTESNFIPGQWQLSRKNVFIGETQKNQPYSSNAGPVNKDTDLKCENSGNNYCLLKDEGISFQLSNNANNQRLLNIYDGPNFQDSNAFFDIETYVVDDCVLGGNDGMGDCNDSESMYGKVKLMPYDQVKNKCYLPNAAIAWKQSNGFYYPPAFNSSNLYFEKVDIRHFVINPLFKKDGPYAFQQDDDAVKENYCTFLLNNASGEGGSFSNYTDIDRQTILNDDDGSLTGLKNTVSVNKDSFFNAPTEAIECGSDGTAKTSPYDYVTTVVYPDCAATKPPPSAPTPPTCVDWGTSCENSTCYGVPLYRQMFAPPIPTPGLEPTPTPSPKDREIRMMGMSIYQRSNLTANNGIYYIDTTVSKDKQEQGLQGNSNSLNVFKGGETYNVLLLFAKDTTKQTYLIYVGNEDPDYKPEEQVKAISSTLTNAPPLPIGNLAEWPTTWHRKWYMDDSSTGILEVTVDLSDPTFKTPFETAKMNRCKPKGFCNWTGDAETGECECDMDLMLTNPELYNQCTQKQGKLENTICSWAVRAVDCPEGGCVGFSFTLPRGFTPPAEPIPPPAPCCYPENSDWNVMFDHATKDVAGDECYYGTPNPPPPPKFCTDPACPM